MVILRVLAKVTADFIVLIVAAVTVLAYNLKVENGENASLLKR